jgi:hypothetical protein
MNRSAAGGVPIALDASTAVTRDGERTASISSAHARTCAAFEAAIGAALDAATRVDQDPVESVHEFRRSARRARAIVAALRDELPGPARREMTATLRAAIRDTGALRDRDVLPETLSTLPVRRGTEEARATLEGELLQRRVDERRPRSRARLLAVAAARLAPLPERFAATLPPELDDDAIGEGVERLARRARKAVRAALAHPHRMVVAHEARKRMRQLAAAHDALIGDAAATRDRADRLARLSKAFGATLDLEVLAEFARRRERVAAGEGSGRLLGQLEKEPRQHRPELLERAAKLLRRRHWSASRLRPQ